VDRVQGIGRTDDAAEDVEAEADLAPGGARGLSGQAGGRVLTGGHPAGTGRGASGSPR